MKKLLFSVFLFVALAPATVFAGGIVTNTNQSASFIRMPALDAVIGVEGVYYNPAGLIHLNDGFHLSFSNQYITQTRSIESDFDLLNQKKFQGDVLAPLFPTFYAVYKKDKVAYSFGVNPIGGGGSANFEKGLPSFEQPFSALPALLTAQGFQTTQYSMESAFDGSSLNWGFQVNATYAVNEMFSFSLGFRMITAKNSYLGHLKNVMVNPTISPAHPFYPFLGAKYAGSMVYATEFFTDASTTLGVFSSQYTALYNGANLFMGNFDPILDDYGTYDISTIVTDAEQFAMLTTIIGMAGYDISGMDLNTVYSILSAAAPVFDATATQLAGQSAGMAGYAQQTSDKEIDAEQKGMGITPIIGVNFKLGDNLNIAMKYEHKADIILTNYTTIDNVGLYPNAGRTPSDMPALFALGVGYKPMEKLNISLGYHTYFDKKANYGKKIDNEFVANEEVIDKNFWEFGLGFEYMVTDAILVSAGYLRTQTGVNDNYQGDMTHSLNTNSIGLGGKYMVNENIGINLGFMTTMYEGYEKEFDAVLPLPSYTETYNREAMVIAFGLDFKF